MFDSLLGFRDEEERNEFLIALPVFAFFGCMLYYFVFGGDQWVADKYAAYSGNQTAVAALAPLSTADMANDNCPDDADSSNNASCATAASDMATSDIAESESAGEIESEADIEGNSANETPAEQGETESQEEAPPIAAVDSDGDGIADENDACPAVAGAAVTAAGGEANGCPDSDGDGIDDALDQCKDNSGPPDNNGCPVPPDTDADGIPDDADQCPEIMGTAEQNGCADEPEVDSDADGISDSADRCATLAGVSDNQGCPADADQDGIADAQDKCPNEVGYLDFAGCQRPELAESAALLELGSGISFEPSSATLTAGSRQSLAAVARVLKRYPGVNLHVDGHTDSVGDAALNQSLSEQRAQACVDFLIENGIDTSRLSSRGYGESKALGDNSTAAGRRKNRRVEFSLSN